MRRFKILHRFISERYISCECVIHRPHEHERLIIHAHNHIQQIHIPGSGHHIPNILTHKRSAPGVPPRRPSLRQMIRQFLSGIITHNLLGKRKFTIEMILIRILRRLPGRRPRPRPHLLRRTPETRPRRRDTPCALTILGPLFIIPPRLIRIRRHMPPRNRRPTHTGEPTHRPRIIELHEPLQSSSRLSPGQPTHTPPRHTRIALSTPQIHALDLPAHVRERSTAQAIRPLGDTRQFPPRAPILPTHSITQIIQLAHNITSGPPILLAGRSSPPRTTRPHSA